MKTINVDGLTDEVIEALRQQVEVLRLLGSGQNSPALKQVYDAEGPAKLPLRSGYIRGELRRVEISDDEWSDE